MYEKLVARLRELASIPEHCENVADCDKCTKEEICLSFTNKRIIEVATQAADAIEHMRPVVRGKWIQDCDYHFRCSVCGNRWIVSNGNPLDAVNGWNFCPNCGADMQELLKEG